MRFSAITEDMRILAIETSCDETGVAVLESSGSFPELSFITLGNALYSQVKVHAQYGGVFPNIAKREHARTLVPLTRIALGEASIKKEVRQDISESAEASLRHILAREGGLADELVAFLKETGRPALDAIAVTQGPGLEPTLWVGITFAEALAEAWGLPLLPANHMEGHLLSSLVRPKNYSHILENVRIVGEMKEVTLPVLALLVSGGHTELILMRDWLSYEYLGSTLDDAVGEAFDKVARIVGLPYPGGPEISKLAERAREKNSTSSFIFPRPMINTKNLDFSFSGLKTAVLYAVQAKEFLTETDKEGVALEFENAVADTLVAKTKKAIGETGAKTFVLGGGVAANTHIRRELKKMVETDFPDVDIRFPDPKNTGDNAVMIAIAALCHAEKEGVHSYRHIAAEGNLSLEK